MMGKQVMKFAPFSGNKANVSDLAPGLYLVSLSVNGQHYQGKVVKE